MLKSRSGRRIPWLRGDRRVLSPFVVHITLRSQWRCWIARAVPRTLCTSSWVGCARFRKCCGRGGGTFCATWFSFSRPVARLVGNAQAGVAAADNVVAHAEAVRAEDEGRAPLARRRPASSPWCSHVERRPASRSSRRRFAHAPGCRRRHWSRPPFARAIARRRNAGATAPGRQSPCLHRPRCRAHDARVTRVQPRAAGRVGALGHGQVKSGLVAVSSPRTLPAAATASHATRGGRDHRGGRQSTITLRWTSTSSRSIPRARESSSPRSPTCPGDAPRGRAKNGVTLSQALRQAALTVGLRCPQAPRS